MKLLLASLLLVYAVQSLPRFSRQLEDLEEYIPNDDGDYSGGDYDGESEMTDESDGDDSFFENEKSRKSSRNARVWEFLEDFQKPLTDAVLTYCPGDKRWIRFPVCWGHIKTTAPLQAASKSSRKFKKAGNARKELVEDLETYPDPPPFSPHKIDLEDDDDEYLIFDKIRQFPEDEFPMSDDEYQIELEDDDESLISDDVLHTPEDILRDVWGEGRMPVETKRGPIKPKSQQHKSARRGGYVRKGFWDDLMDVLRGEPIETIAKRIREYRKGL
ncbi:hypothetical protein CAEBREN_11406 [Caenorhabditis brenneri]|uniref:Uncharacterized protein n=1 Tax=Caenorhabditis brenneri TaxID=135651 RepID=G0MD45_CAEBE|nr:hypothetical protein CAEBREN_11406 [Caenorhabditis brenneri]